MHHNFISTCCSRKHGFISFPKYLQYYLSDKSCNIQQQWIQYGLRKLYPCFIYSQLREITKFQSTMIPRKLKAVLRNRMATKWCFIMTQSYSATKTLSNELNASLAEISKLWMEHEKVQYNNKATKSVKYFPGFPIRC